MTDGVLHLYLIQLGPVIQLNRDSISDGALFGIMILDAETLVFDAAYLSTEFIDTRIGSCRVGTSEGKSRLVPEKGGVNRDDSLAFRGQLSEDERICNHVLNGMTRGFFG
jgi:hypothetical protein